MSFEGLLLKFKVNRPLTQNEINRQLHQNRKLILGDNDLCDDISVIKINSLYMDTANRFYKGKGFGAMTTLLAIIFLFFIISVPIWSIYDFRIGVMISIVVGLIMSPGLGFAVYCFLKEAFTWTHYPIRFNREKQLLHVFKFDANVITVPWNSIFFTTGKPGIFGAKETDIRGHILADDGITVLDTFSLGVFDRDREAYRYWEFVRRYMSLPEGPEEVLAQNSEVSSNDPYLRTAKDNKPLVWWWKYVWD